MSFANRMRAKRAGRKATMIAAIAASLGMAGVVAPPVAAPLDGVGAAASQTGAPREFVDEKTRKRRANPTVTNRVKGGGRRRFDSRRARRRFIMLLLRTENSGRQWVRARRGLRKTREGQLVLSLPAWKLAQIAERMGLLS